MSFTEAGKYWRKYVRLKRTTTKEQTYGQDAETFTPAQEYWGYQEELRANELLALGMKQSQAAVKVHIRGLQVLTFKDRLQDKQFGDIYFIDGVNIDRDKDELVVLAHRQET